MNNVGYATRHYSAIIDHMPDETKNMKNEIHEEADDLITLGNLLRIDRNEADQLSIEKIMHRDLNIREKISLITEINLSEESNTEIKKNIKPEKEAGPVGTRSDKVKNLKKYNDRIPMDTYPQLKNVVSIKANHNPPPYLTYLFREYRKIRDFGKRTHVLLPVFFPPSVKLNKDLGASFTKYLLPKTSQLLDLLNPVLEIGWLYLSKFDYNLIAMLKRLCLEINSMNFYQLNYRDKNLLNKFRKLENLFLVLYYRPEYPERIISAVETVLRKNRESRDNILTISKLIRSILGKQELLPSLYNFLLGLNMRKSNRYLTLSELMLRSNSEIIISGYFDCEPRIQDKIQSYIKKSVKLIMELNSKKKEIQKQRIFLPTDENGEADFSQLQLFYETSQLENKYNYDKDRENVVLFIPQFLRLFLHTFENILNGKVLLSKMGKSEIFLSNFFQIEFTKLIFIIKQMDKIAFNYPNFPRNRFLGIKTSNTGAITIESEFMHLTEESLVHLLSIAKKLSTVLGLRQKSVESEDEVEPLSLNVLRGKSFILPYEEDLIESETIINGSTVLQSLTMAISISFLVGIYLNDQTSISLLKMEKNFELKIQSALEKLEKIIDNESYLELKDKVK
jgi:hypothetical protein